MSEFLEILPQRRKNKDKDLIDDIKSYNFIDRYKEDTNFEHISMMNMNIIQPNILVFLIICHFVGFLLYWQPDLTR